MKAIPVARPILGEEEAAAARRAILSGWVVQGPEVAAFEKEFAAAVGAGHAVACSSGTAALHLALLAMDIGPGDEIITVSHSFIATANAVRYVGATPVFVDVEPQTGNINPDLIEPAITAKTKAILAVHQLGMPCDLARILKIANNNGLPVIEDAACAVGSEIRAIEEYRGRGKGPESSFPLPQTPSPNPLKGWEGGMGGGQGAALPGPPPTSSTGFVPIGRPHGLLATFSFHPRKVITTGDGGMVTGTDPEIMARIARLRTHSMSVSTAERHRAKGVVFEEYQELGCNYRLSDIQAAVGREQLKRLPGMVAARRRLAARYLEELANHPYILLPQEPPWARSNWQSFWITLAPQCPVSQIEVLQSLKALGIDTRRGVMCAHREPAYQDLPPRFPLPVSEMLRDRSIILPLYPDMTEPEQERVVAALLDSLGQ
ncbi:MAG: DegT/DnrJ/EryC1/StrS family aminotransferase [Deltaproteobacteria bacterium]|nr:DegT/DnrJ/EryC1/StrS family aminotransferase [Deltaproteobacteria bacterium]